MRYLRKGILLLVFLSFFLISEGQQTNSDTIISVSAEKYHSPKKAALYAAIFPGLGQAYNKKYWKLPILYGGIGTLIYFIDFNSERYNFYRKAHLDIVYNVPNGAYTEIDNWDKITNLEEQIKNNKDRFHRYRDLTYIIMGFTYVLSIIDATVDAHMFNYDISKDLSLNLQPTVLNCNAYSSGGFGLKLSLNLNSN